MKTTGFEKITFNVVKAGTTLMSVRGHKGETFLYLSPSEVQMLIADLQNHSALVKEAVDTEKARVNLEWEKRKC